MYCSSFGAENELLSANWKLRASLKDQGIIPIAHQEFFIKKSFFSKRKWYLSFFEVPRFDLKLMKDVRAQQNAPFQGSSLENLLKSQVQAHHSLQMKEYFFPGLSPEYIGNQKTSAFRPDSWQLILIDMIPSELFLDLQRSLIAKGKSVYLHPELYELLKQGVELGEFDGFKENTFALGLMLLEAGLLVSVEGIYADRVDPELGGSLIRYYDLYFPDLVDDY